MGLASLWNVPNTDITRNRFSFNNQDLHIRTNQRIFNALGLRLTYYPLDPMPDNKSLMESWLYQHQDIHNQTNVALGTSGNDLSVVDFENKDQLDAWLFLHQREHNAWELKLGSALG